MITESKVKKRNDDSNIEEDSVRLEVENLVLNEEMKEDASNTVDGWNRGIKLTDKQVQLHEIIKVGAQQSISYRAFVRDCKQAAEKEGVHLINFSECTVSGIVNNKCFTTIKDNITSTWLIKYCVHKYNLKIDEEKVEGKYSRMMFTMESIDI